MRFINFLILKLAGCLTLGILLGYYFPTPPAIGITLGITLLVLLGLFWFLERKKLKQGPLFGLLTFLVFTSVGYLNLQLTQPHFQQDHYFNKKISNETQLIQIRIVEILKSNRYYDNYFAEVIQLNRETVTGKLLLNLKKPDTLCPFKIDDVLWIASEIKDIKPALNPYQFNYKQYLKEQGVYHQAYVSEEEVLKIEEGNFSLKGFSEHIRHTISEKLKNISLDKDALAITHALVLGERKELRKELYANYASAGAVHILAVSGLHVGILFLFFSWILKPLELIRYGKHAKICFIVLLLWGFAFIAGLSPSVVRAVTMFSCFALAGLLNRPTNGFNTLFLSYFTLLLIKPIWLFHVGFQLSYLAVFSILWLQPKFQKLYKPKTLLDKYLWGIITVTISAQIGVAPLSIYYFHQFPGLFLLTNMIVLPFLGFLLALGLIIVAFTWFDSTLGFMIKLYNLCIQWLNGFIDWVASQDIFLFRDISLSFPKMIAIYSIILALGGFWMKQRKSLLFWALASMVMLLGITRWEQKKYSNEELIVFHMSSKNVLGYKKGKHITLFSNDTIEVHNAHPIKGYRIGQYISEHRLKHIPNFFEIKGKRVLRLDSLGLFPNKDFDIVLLSESPKIHLERLIDSVQPKLIIANGSNYTSYIRRWQKTCKKRKLPFHNTREMGAYVFK